MTILLRALVLSGADPAQPGALALGEGVANKALIEVGGAPMVRRVIDALQSCPRISDITLVGLSAQEAAQAGIPETVMLLPNQPSLVDNVLAGMEHYRARLGEDARVLMLDADTPLLTGEMITWFVDACRPYDRDVYYAVVGRPAVEEVFPNSRRTYLRTREGRVCSADLFVLHIAAVLRSEARMRDLVARRKSVFAQLRLLGWSWVLRLLLGRIHLWELRAAAEKMLGVSGEVIELPFAEAAMDVDKDFQLAMVRNYWAQNRAAQGAAAPVES